MLKLDNDWVWDSWPFDHAGRHHLFFLKAPRSLGEPELRHSHASIGHAVGDDYRTWEVLPDVLAPAASPAWDDGATWTGSVVQGPDGRFHLFYTGASLAEDILIQRIGRADSDDLVRWERFGSGPLLEVDPRWYEKYDGHSWHDEAWRDPWVFADPDGNGWHMFITARVNHGDPWSRGVIGYAWSPDLDQWEVRPPLSDLSAFGQLEVPQWVPRGEGGGLLVFNCGAGELNPSKHVEGQVGGVWVVDASTCLGPFDIDSARRVDHPSVYAARVVTLEDGSPAVLGFSNVVDGEFVGEILDPIPLV